MKEAEGVGPIDFDWLLLRDKALHEARYQISSLTSAFPASGIQIRLKIQTFQIAEEDADFWQLHAVVKDGGQDYMGVGLFHVHVFFDGHDNRKIIGNSLVVVKQPIAVKRKRRRELTRRDRAGFFHAFAPPSSFSSYLAQAR